MKCKQKRPQRAALALGAAALVVACGSMASSHREAPMITELPKVDGTDVYAFRSYEPGRADFVTLIVNYVPFQDPFAGPNYYFMDPDALYEIHVDNNGDGHEDLTFQFKFKHTLKNTTLPVGGKNIPIPLINSGPITDVNPPTLNMSESYTVSLVRGPRRSMGSTGSLVNMAGGAAEFQKPVDNIGNKSIPDYAAYAARHLYNVTIPGCTPGRLFVGQRREGFGVNVGEIFDLVNMPPARVIGSRSGSTNPLAGKNITTLAIEVPIACLTSPGEPVIGVWTTASLPRSRLVSDVPLGRVVRDRNLVQVSRLGMPLVNEIVIGLKDKDGFNASMPADDAQFADYVTNPTLPALLELLFSAAGVRAPTIFPRTDLVAVFLTGVPNVNKPRTGVPAEMMRLNTALPTTPKGSQNSLGAALCFVEGALALSNPGCDPAGFPNGRRPGDDVVDIELRVAMGYLLPPGGGKPASANLPYTDGVLVEDSQFDGAFPYLRTPLPGSPNGANGVPANPTAP